MNPSQITAITPLRKRRDFVAMRSGQRQHNRAFVLQALARTVEARASDANCRVGFTVTKKLGNAVIRNRIKRRLRAIAAITLISAGKPAYDYVLIGKKDALRANFATMSDELGHALKKLHGNSPKISKPAGKSNG